MSSAEPDKDVTRTAGRGLVSIAFAKVFFIVGSYAVQLVLPRILTPESFGLYSSALNVVSILNNVLIVSTVQSVSKFVSENGPRSGSVLRFGLLVQTGVGLVAGSALFLGADGIAQLLYDERLGPLLRIASAVVFSYALYAALVGALNGRHLFQRQASLDMTFSVLRMGGILGAAAMGWGALGAVAGFSAAAVIILLIAIAWVGFGDSHRDAPVTLRRWLVFTAPLWLYHGFLNGLMQIDLALLKRTIAALALEGGFSPLEAADLASRQAGFYRAAQTFAFVPYQLILSLTFIIFPMIAKATAEGDAEVTRRYIRAALRVSTLFLVSIAAPIAGAAAGVMRIAYRDEYLAGSGALRILVLAMAAFALFVIAATILTSAGRPFLAAAAAGFALIVVVAGNIAFVRWAGLDGGPLEAAATGTAAGTGLALILVAGLLYWQFRTFLPLSTTLRSAIAGVLAFLASSAIPHQTALGALISLAGGFFVFLAALVVTRELGRDDLLVIRRVLKR